MTSAPPPAAAPAAPMVYRYRRGTLEHESGWTLGANALVRAQAGAQPQHLPYREIVELRLSSPPVLRDRRRFRCDLATADGRRATLRSTSYVSVGRFEDRGDSYAPFVRELVARVAKAAPQCRFRAGKRAWAFWLEHASLLAMLLALAAAISFAGGLPLYAAAGIKLAVLAVYVALAFRFAGTHWPRSFAPDRIPPDAMP